MWKNNPKNIKQRCDNYEFLDNQNAEAVKSSGIFMQWRSKKAHNVETGIRRKKDEIVEKSITPLTSIGVSDTKSEGYILDPQTWNNVTHTSTHYEWVPFKKYCHAP